MKSITEYINESIIKEASGEFLVMFNHETPGNLYIVCGATKDQVDFVKGLDWFYETVPYKEGNLYEIVNNDETLNVTDLKCNSESQLKAKVMKSIKDSLKKAEPDYVYVEFDPLSIGNEFEEMGEGLMTEAKPEQFYKWVCDLYNESYVDGDSNSERIVFDTRKKACILGPNNHMIFTPEEFQKWIDENNED
jgi:hypothetical protein